MSRFFTQYAAINSGGTVSDPVGVQGAEILGLWAPVITSGNVLLRGAFENVSASYVPIQRVDVTTPALAWAWPCAAGSKAIPIDLPAAPFPFIKIETSVAQADVRTFVVVGKFA